MLLYSTSGFHCVWHITGISTICVLLFTDECKFNVYNVNYWRIEALREYTCTVTFGGGSVIIRVAMSQSYDGLLLYMIRG